MLKISFEIQLISKRAKRVSKLNKEMVGVEEKGWGGKRGML